MFKPTPVCFGARRLPLTSKQGHNYYKGNRVGALGRHTRRGKYLIDYNKVRTYVVPKGLHDSKLSPFVPRGLPPPKPQYKDSFGGSGFGPHAYLRAWNRNDSFPSTPGKAAILEERYKAAELSVAPTLFSRSNLPPVGKVVIVDKKKARKMKKHRIRSRKALRKIRKRQEKLLAKKTPVVL